MKTEFPGEIVIIESPYAGDVQRNLAYLDRCIRDSLMRGEIPVASHKLYPGALDDNNLEERKLGIEAGYHFWQYAAAVVFYTDLGWSEGMKAASGRVRYEAVDGPTHIQRQILGSQEKPTAGARPAKPAGPSLELSLSSGAIGIPLKENSTVDLRARSRTVLRGGQYTKVETTIQSIKVPPGFEAQIRPSRVLAEAFGVTTFASPVGIDEHFTGVISVLLANHENKDYVVAANDIVGQLVIAPVARLLVEAK